MAETGIVRFPGSLDPRAQEYTPINPTLFRPPHLFYPYAPPPAAPLHHLPSPAAVGVPYPHTFSAPPAAAYVSQVAVSVSTPAASPPCSSSPTRSLLLTSVPAETASETTLRRELEVFGDVRGVQMERVREGIVTVHFYDLRHAETALMAIRKQHMQQQTRLRNHYASLLKKNNSTSFETPPPPPPPHPAARGLISGRAVWAQYVVPAHNAVPEGQNQGTIVIFYLDSEVSSETLRQTFEAYGAVKELRDTPSKKNQKFVEFFDVRDAAKALKHMNGKQIEGKKIVIEFSRPGGHGRKFFHNNAIPKMPSSFNNINNNNPPSSPRKNARRFFPPPPPQLSSLSLSSSKKPNGNKSNSNNNNNATADSVSENHGMTKQQQQQQQLVVGRRNWKGGRQGRKQESRFLIKEDAIVESSNCKDSRTTLMIKNIPNKYSQKLLLNMLDNHCIHCNEQTEEEEQPLSAYDFVYLPIDFNNKCNVGYGFVNMTSPEAALRLYKAFHLQHWEVFNSRKICEVTYARVQGVEALKEHFKNSKFPCEMEHYLPVVFSPARDGRNMTEPHPIVGQTQSQHDDVDDEDGADHHDSSCSSENGGVQDQDST